MNPSWSGHTRRLSLIWKTTAVGDSPVNTSLPAVEQAAWMIVASQIMNTDQALNK